MLGNRQPVLGAHWQPMAGHPPQQSPASVLLPKAIREVLIFGGLTILAARFGVLGHPAGWLAILAGRGLVGELRNLWREKRIVRTALGWVAVAVIAAVVATTPPTTVHKVKAPHLKAPVNVEASQADYLAKAREVWADAYAQTLGRGASKPIETKKKEGR